MFELRRGHSTDAFKGHIEYRGIDQLPPSRLCFSLVANTRTLDLAASDDVSLNRWLDRIGEMMSRPRDVVVVTASPAAQDLMPKIVTSPSRVDGKTKERWRRKMGKYVRGSLRTNPVFFTLVLEWVNFTNTLDTQVRKNHIAGVLTLLKEGCPVDLALETNQTADASVDTALLLSCQAGHDTMVCSSVIDLLWQSVLLYLIESVCLRISVWSSCYHENSIPLSTSILLTFSNINTPNASNIGTDTTSKRCIR